MYSSLYRSYLIMAIVAVSSSVNAKTKNKEMEYIVSDRNVKQVENRGHRLLHESNEFSSNVNSVILSEEDAQELRNHGYNVEENKKVYTSVFHKKSKKDNNKRRHLTSAENPSSTEEYAAWGRAFAFSGNASWFEQFKDFTPTNPVKICVASTGIDITHEDLPSDRVIGLNVSDIPEPWFEDVSGHGTHTAGIIAAIGGNGKGVQGIIDNDWNSKFELVIGKVAYGPGGTGTLKTQIEAIDNCISQGANVVALTVGSYCASDEEREYFDSIYKNNDTLVFSASGTDPGSRGDDSRFYPAAYPSVVSVIGVDHNETTGDIVHDNSNIHEQIELAGPGTFIWSTALNNTYEEDSGSAIGVAHVAGVAGILRAVFPDCKNYEIRAAMAATATQKADKKGCNTMFGHGMVNAKAAFALLSQGNCGGDIGEVEPVGGCHQLKNPTLDSSCAQDSDCDDQDACTVDTCSSGVCEFTHDCAGCGLSETVTVDIKTDLYSSETSWEVLDGVTDEQVWGRNFTFGNCIDSYTVTKCFPEGSFLFVIYDEGFDGICCKYGEGGYSVTVGDNIQVSGGKFKQVKASMFHVGESSSEPSMTLSPVTAPTQSVEPTGTYTPTTLPTNTAPPTAAAICISDASCDDLDPCTLDTCGSDSKCTNVADCTLTGCGYTELITVDINTDNHPEETKWTVSDYDTKEILWNSPKYSEMNSPFSHAKCFPIGLYVYTIYDVADDGLCCDYGQGNYTVLVGTKVYAQGSDYEDIKAHLLFVRESSEPSSSPSDEPSSSPSDIPTNLPSTSPSDLPTNVPSVSPSDVPTKVPSASPSNVPSTTPSSAPSSKPSSSPSDVPSAAPSSKPSGTPSSSPSSAPSATPSASPSSAPSATPSSAPSSKPSGTPSDVPSATPSSKPSAMPSDVPSSAPSAIPSASPSSAPSATPSSVPSSKPSSSPSDVPSATPSSKPSVIPSDVPSSAPSAIPSTSPSSAPSTTPSSAPSSKPSGTPSDVPSATPSSKPSAIPSDVPSSAPSATPSSKPSTSPSDIPSSAPSKTPSDIPSASPSLSCALEGEDCLDASPNGKQCCGGHKSLTCNLLSLKCEKWCSNPNQTSKECGAPAHRDHIPPNCCSGLECETDYNPTKLTKYCVEPEANVCSRTDNTLPWNTARKEGYNYGYSKACGGVKAKNTRCCPGTSCDHTEEWEGGSIQYQKRCVDCASKDERAAECDRETRKTFPDIFYDEQVTGVKKICCTGLECDYDRKVCKNAHCAADGKNAKECGASKANKDHCCDKHVCVNKKCVRSSLLPCAPENGWTKECGFSWSSYHVCCHGLVCDSNTNRCVPK